jgi:hypothetical protein
MQRLANGATVMKRCFASAGKELKFGVEVGLYIG